MIAPLLMTLLAPSLMGDVQATKPAQKPKVVVSVNVQDGATISGDVRFVVKVDAQNPVNQVEFYVGGNIRDSDESTPYEFGIDTIAENDGPLKVEFAAYTSEGESGKVALNLKVDNGLGKGIQYHLDQGREYLTTSNWDKAIQSGRVALKIDGKNNRARLLMARAFLGKNILDSAQKFAEDALADEPKLIEAADLLGSINLRKAFNTFNRAGSNRDETLESIRNSMMNAVKNRRMVLDSQVDGFGAINTDNRMAYADLAIKAGRYSLVIQTLAEPFRQATNNSAMGNRLAYAHLRAGRVDDAAAVLTALKRVNALDGYSYALLAIVEQMKGSEQASDDMMREAILNEPDSIGVLTAQTFIALKRGRNDVAQGFATRLARDQGQRTESMYYLSILQYMKSNFTEARTAFERSLLAEPTNYDMYVQAGNQALVYIANNRPTTEGNATQEFQYQVKVANSFYDTALVAKPDSPEALTGKAIVGLFAKTPEQSLSFARAAAAAGANYAPARYTYSMVLSVMESRTKGVAEEIRRRAQGGTLSSDQQAEVRRLENQANEFGKLAVAEMKAAENADKTNLSGRNIPTLDDVYRYFARHGKLPLLVPPM